MGRGVIVILVLPYRRAALTRPDPETSLLDKKKSHHLPKAYLFSAMSLGLNSTRLSLTRPTARGLSWSAPCSSAYARPLPLFLGARGRNGIASTENEDLKGRRLLRMLMFGKPGAGKGTLTARLVKTYDVVSLSTGDLLRRHIDRRTEVGREAEEIVASGGLLPDEVMLRVVSSELDELRNQHWILDGFPRTLGQAELLDAHLK